MSHPQDNTRGLLINASQKRLRRLAAWSIPLVAAACVFAASDMAHADEVQPLTLVAWTVTDPANIWNPPQVLFASVQLPTADLHALDSQLLCGTTYQLDLYNSGPVTDALVAGGILYGPSDPQEDLIGGGDGVAYMVVTTPACVPPVEPPVVVPPVVPPVPPATPVTEAVLAETGLNPLPLLLGGIGMVGIGVLARRFAA